MQSTFSGIEIGKRGLFSHQSAIHTIGHNLTNIDSDGYSRQQISLQSFDPFVVPGLNRPSITGQIGQGPTVASITRVRDSLLEMRIVNESSGEEFWKTRDRYLRMLERIYNEPTELSVRNLLDKFWESWQNLALHPDQSGARQATQERAAALIEGIRHQYLQMEEVRSMLDREIQVTVGEINQLINDIGDLNLEIAQARAAALNPNDLLDRRDLLVEQLATYIDISTSNRDADDYTIYSQGLFLVQGEHGRPLEVAPNPLQEGFSMPIWQHNGERFINGGGRLGALESLRDQDLTTEIRRLDDFSINLTDLVNEIHRSAYGADGSTGTNFFVEIPRVIDTDGNFDSDGDGLFDVTYLFRVSGENQLETHARIGFGGTISIENESEAVTIDYTATDTVGQLLDRINNANTQIVARLNREGGLELKALSADSEEFPDYVIRSLEDSGQFLVGYAGLLNASGAAGAYNWQQADAVGALRPTAAFATAPLLHPAGWIGINPDIADNIQSIAAAIVDPGGVFEIGNSDAALAIAALRNNPVLVGSNQTFDEHIAETIASVGLRGERADLTARTQEQIVKQLKEMRASLSGVNIDEEVAELIKHQHGYAATARFITNVDSMLDTIINRMAV